MRVLAPLNSTNFYCGTCGIGERGNCVNCNRAATVADDNDAMRKRIFIVGLVLMNLLVLAAIVAAVEGI